MSLEKNERERIRIERRNIENIGIFIIVRELFPFGSTKGDDEKFLELFFQAKLLDFILFIFLQEEGKKDD